MPLVLFLIAISFSCTTGSKDPVIIWTNNKEMVSYAELFNATHEDAKAVVVYKEEPARSLPPAKDEVIPDIIIGSWLKNSTTRKYFSPLDYLVSEKQINRSDFYSHLIDYGVINEKQYLIPVSFNLPAIVFNKNNEKLIKTDHFLSLTQLRDISASFNVTNKSGAYTAMGYGPSWDTDFLYTATKLKGASYREKGTSFNLDENALNDTVAFLRDWTALNTDTEAEQNFQFKYLYMPKYRLLSSTDRCLFAYMTSNEFFTLTDEQSTDLSFRWLAQNDKIPVEDNIICMGLYRHSRNVPQAEVFISWLCKEETQKALMERTASMKLDTKVFGIAGGFSAIHSVNENVFPTYYRQLLSNLPAQDYLTLPNILPYRWQSLKSRVIIPYLRESTNTNNTKQVKTLEELIADWNRQYF